jgi:hypothetical protein
MATTTNYGWDTPDDTDLVKDGAAAIRTLGQSIDTSMMDLEGGTTGQILAKNSGTDMDFVFIDNDTGIITAYEAKTDNYTIASGDEYNIFSMNAATDKEFRIPTDATFNFAIGTEINFFLDYRSRTAFDCCGYSGNNNSHLNRCDKRKPKATRRQLSRDSD